MDKLGLKLLIVCLILFSLYFPLNTPNTNLYQFKTFVDDLVPLWTPFIVIYISYFVFLAFTLYYFIKQKNFNLSNTIFLAIIFSCLISYFVYLLFQNYIVRPVIEEHNIFDSLYLWINSWVAPYNAFPSLHVAISTICLIGYSKLNSKFFPVIFIWVILIILSTMLSKQHYFLDVVSGLILGIVTFLLSKKLIKKYA